MQIFLSTRWAILLNLHVEMFRVNKYPFFQTFITILWLLKILSWVSLFEIHMLLMSFVIFDNIASFWIP